MDGELLLDIQVMGITDLLDSCLSKRRFVYNSVAEGCSSYVGEIDPGRAAPNCGLVVCTITH